jgi:hypothetical protein
MCGKLVIYKNCTEFHGQQNIKFCYFSCSVWLDLCINFEFWPRCKPNVGQRRMAEAVMDPYVFDKNFLLSRQGLPGDN